MIRITALLYAPSRKATVATTTDGHNYVLPVFRDPTLVVKFCRLVRDGLWELSYTEEGMKLLLAAPDLERQEMSF